MWGCSWLMAQSSWMDRLLGLRELSWATPDASLGWEHPLPAWVWVLIVLGACGFAAWSYSRLLGPRPMRVALAALRASLIVLVAVLLAGPTLIDPDEREEPDAVVLLVDRSASMNIRDMHVPASSGSTAAISRDEALRRAVLSQAAAFGEQGLSAGVREMVWLGFGDQVSELPPLTTDAAWRRPQVRADAPATALRSGIEQALQVAAGRPLASVIVFSDGRTPQSTGADLIRQVAQRGTRIHVVALGPAQPGFDLMLQQVEAPEQAFTSDPVPITVRIEQAGSDEGFDLSRVRVQLTDLATGQVVDEWVPGGDAGIGDLIRLTARSDEVGQVRYRVDVVYEPAGDSDPGELVTSNNTRQIVIDMIDRPVRVLYVEGYPRWEYRYLKNMLVREESIDSSILLLSADQAFAQEGDSPITRPPGTAAELRPYDVIILGDVPPGYFTPEQLTLMRDHVAVSSAGLLWIGGPRHTPGSYAGSPLEDLLPMRSAGAVQPVSVPVVVEPTPLAQALQVLQLRGPGTAQRRDAAGTWPDELTPLRWMQNLGALKPTAEVLAQAVHPGSTDSTSTGDELSLLVRLRYGAGQSLYLATDETWRWRYGRGELYFEQFWVQLVRMLGRHRVQQTIDRARLSVSHRQVDVEQPVVVELTVEDPALLARELPRVRVSVDRTGAQAAATVDQVQLVAQMHEQVENRRVYRAVWRPMTPGSMILRVTEPALDALGLSRAMEVVAADDEMRQVAADHDRLIALAAATGGEVVPLDQLDRLPVIVPNLATRTAVDARESLWQSWLALILVLGLLTTEWIVRKVTWLV